MSPFRDSIDVLQLRHVLTQGVLMLDSLVQSLRWHILALASWRSILQKADHPHCEGKQGLESGS